MLSPGLLYLAALVAITAFAVVMLKRRGYLAVAAKGAFGSFTALLIICFVYGLFNRFSFWHGAAPPGLESGIGYAIILGVTAGPVVFVVGGLASAAISRFRKSKKRNAGDE
jgi:hypothetical protein